ncbi:MAG: GTP 3',8-cyclase MoaA, partial [Actinomadura rubrobrunea]|nr:GTP 3',8-cyclase MoaA [Actinomadura rubrobrunea]
MLVDTFGRTATDLRVSLTDRCNLRCSYCMPPEGLEWLPKPEVLTDDEVVRLVRVAVERLGVTEVRYTGGEPLLRRGLVDIVRRTAALRPRPQISITTNGIGLERMAVPLAEAGLDRVNVSLDTLDPAVFRRLAHRDRLDDVLRGLAAAADAGLAPVKVNAVLMRGVNDHEAVPLLRYCLERGYLLRFIEQMPLDAQHGWTREGMVTADEILARLGEEFTLTPEDPAARGSAPAAARRGDGGAAAVGV